MPNALSGRGRTKARQSTLHRGCLACPFFATPRAGATALPCGRSVTETYRMGRTENSIKSHHANSVRAATLCPRTRSTSARCGRAPRGSSSSQGESRSWQDAGSRLASGQSVDAGCRRALRDHHACIRKPGSSRDASAWPLPPGLWDTAVTLTKLEYPPFIP